MNQLAKISNRYKQTMSDRLTRSAKAAESERVQSQLTAELWSRLNFCQQKAKKTTEDNKHCIEVYRQSGRKRSPNCQLKPSGTAIHDFNKMKYKEYLSRAKLKDVTMDASLQMFAQFITYVKENHREDTRSFISTKDILLWVIDQRRDIFGAYADSLDAKSSNKRHRLDAVISAVSFLFEKQQGSEVHLFADALSILNNTRKQLTKASRVDKRAAKKDREERVRIHAYPRGGLKEIRDNLHDGWDYFDALVAVAQAGKELTESEYTECLRYVLATLWGYDNNARPLAIETLCLEDVQIKLEGHDFALSQNFKTYEHYTYQVVKFSLVVSEIWVPIIRAQVLRRCGCVSDRVFVKFNGRPLLQSECTRHVQEFFKRYGLVITVTTLRSILETAYKDAAAAGVISERARTSLTLSQGHSERTAEEYYLPGPAGADAIVKAVEDVDAFDALCASLDVNEESRDDASCSIESRIRNVKARTDTHIGLLDVNVCFGVAYSGKNKSANGQRFEWTEDELSWITAWFAKAYAELPLGTTHIPNRYAACLNDLHQASPEVKAMFHPHHVANSDRFKNGAQKVERRMGALPSK